MGIKNAVAESRRAGKAFLAARNDWAEAGYFTSEENDRRYHKGRAARALRRAGREICRLALVG